MKLLAAASVVLTVLLTPFANAQTNPVVIELFTSQGCSSCPPADKLLHQLAERDDVIALALHVDYWDYIGWADSFARPEHTDRQRKYAHIGGRKMIYTPQMVINGQEDVVGAHAMEVMDLIAKHKAIAPMITIELKRAGSTLEIRAEVLEPVQSPLIVQIVRYVPRQTVEIKRGENAGRTLSYANVVQDWMVLGEWTGAEPFEAEADLPGEDAAAVLVQYPGPGEILAAARIE